MDDELAERDIFDAVLWQDTRVNGPPSRRSFTLVFRVVYLEYILVVSTDCEFPPQEQAKPNEASLTISGRARCLSSAVWV